MEKLIKSGIIVVFILSVVCLGVTTVLFSHKINERERADALTGCISKAAVEFGLENSEEDVLRKLVIPGERDKLLSSLEENITRTINDLDKTKSSLKKAKKNLTEKINEAKKLADDLQVEKKERDQLKIELEKQISLAQKLVKELELEREKTKQIEEKLSGLSHDLETLSSGKQEMLKKVKRLEEEKMALKKRLQELSKTTEGSVPLDPIYVRAETKFSGNVLAVNAKYNFVVVNIGSAEGLINGDELIISRGKTLVGKVKVEKVDDKMAVANILPEWLQEPMKEGDNVNKF
ncbi:MAG: hypothetical protein U9Q21_01955 [Candidatus Auribacterota bacterium]|nr:hypothetical protein [Candidatus Auribacterota bacterium]